MRRAIPLVCAVLLLAGCGSTEPTDGHHDGEDQPARLAGAGARDDEPQRRITTGETESRPPASVTIPAIDVESPLEDLGLADDGSMEVPGDPGLAGWLTPAGRPGGPGPLVIAGHVDSATGPAVFSRLRELEPGDVVVVADDAGRVFSYEVTGVEDVPRDDFPTVEVFGAVPDDELRLITCHGDYHRGSGYTDNLVVYATPT